MGLAGQQRRFAKSVACVCAADHGARAICFNALRAGFAFQHHPIEVRRGSRLRHCGARRGGDPLHTIHANQRVKVRFSKNTSLRQIPFYILKRDQLDQHRFFALIHPLLSNPQLKPSQILMRELHRNRTLAHRRGYPLH